MSADYDLTDQPAIDAGQLPDYTLVLADLNGATTTISPAALVKTFVARRPVFHSTRPDPDHHPDVRENCTVLRLETVTVPIGSITGIDRSKVAAVGLMPAPGMARYIFFDSIQLIRH